MKWYEQGYKMFREYCVRYGEKDAREICNRYLDLQLFTNNKEELEFCRGLYDAMR